MVLDRRGMNNFLRRRFQHELLVGMREGVVRDQRSDVAEFRGFRFQKIAPRRHAVKKIGDADRRPRGQSLRIHANQFAARKFDARSLRFFGGASLQQQPRNRSNRRQRLAAKPQRGDREQIIRGTQFGRRVPLKRQQRIVVAIPDPSSITRIMRLPPDSTSTRIDRAPASSAFSSSSFTTDAGRSTTSPAAILFATCSASMRMRVMSRLIVAPTFRLASGKSSVGPPKGERHKIISPRLA